MLLRSRGYGWYVLALLAGLNIVNYATRNVVVTMYPDLRSAFELDNTQLGWLSSAFMFAHAGMNVPFGWLADRLDRRRVLALGAVIWSLANLAVAIADSFGLLIAGRILAGIGTAACVPIANALVCDVFPEDRKARSVAVLNVGLFLGGGVGIVLGNQPGFPLAFVIVAVPGFVLAFLAARIEISPHAEDGASASVSLSLTGGALSVLRIPTIRWMISGAVGAAFAAGGYLAWFADFLARAKGFDPDQAMMLLGVLGLTGGLGGVVCGAAVGDRLMRAMPHGRLVTIALSFAAAAPCALVSIYSPRGVPFYVASWLLMFFISWYHGPMAAAVDDRVDDRRAALAQATFIFLMHLLGTATAPVLVGALVDRVGIEHALVAPTVAVVLAALAFARAAATARDAANKSC